MPANSVITYDGLPVSSGGAHTLKTKDPLLALRQINEFIESCTIASAPIESSVEVVSGLGVPDSFFKPLHEEFTDRYGTEVFQGLGNNTGHSWAIPLGDVQSVVQRLASQRPLPLHPFGLQPACVRLGLKFRFRSIDGTSELPGQGADNYLRFVPGRGQVLGESEIYARVSEKTTASVFLNFPFEGATTEFLHFRAFVQDHLPFRMSNLHWKRWTLTKKGDNYLGRKFGGKPDKLGVIT